jgi:hypothetical protein
VTEEEIAAVLTHLGSPADKARTMAAQLAKRAAQLAEQKGRPYDEALRHLLQITAQSGGFSQEPHD